MRKDDTGDEKILKYYLKILQYRSNFKTYAKKHNLKMYTFDKMALDGKLKDAMSVSV